MKSGRVFAAVGQTSECPCSGQKIPAIYICAKGDGIVIPRTKSLWQREIADSCQPA